MSTEYIAEVLGCDAKTIREGMRELKQLPDDPAGPRVRKSGGGSNSCRKHLFKEDLQALVNELRIPIRVAHYPAYCSKFNPIERRLFCHVMSED
jgi:hypothetical protein